MKKIDTHTALLLVGLVLLLLVLPLSLRLVSERQEIRKKAAGPSGTATLRLDPQTNPTPVPPGQALPVTIKFRTPTTPDNKGIIIIEAVLRYAFSGANPPFSLAQGDQSTDITGGLSSPWNYSFKKVSTSGNIVTIEIVASYDQAGENGYLDAVSSEKDFAVINFHAQNPGTIDLVFDQTRTVIRSKSGNQDILFTPSNGQYAVGGGATTTPTVTPTLTVTPTPPAGDAPTITRFSNFCGKPSETVLVLYGTKFGAERGNSKIIFRYKAKPFDADSTYQEVEVPTGNFITWTDEHVAFKIPQVSFGSNSFVIAKIKMIKAGYEDQPALFPPQNVVFFTIAQSLPRNIGDLNCDNVVNEADFAILLNNYNL